MTTNPFLPSDEQAMGFAIMLQAGLPADQAILYFIDSEDPKELTTLLGKWMRSRALQKAQLALMGKSWQDMGLDERIQYALNQHYSQLAYFLFSNNVSSMGSQDKAKADTARVALEAKLAGTAGKTDALTRFFQDVQDGKLKLLPTPIKPVAH